MGPFSSSLMCSESRTYEGSAEKISEISAVGPVLCADGEMSGDSRDKREVEPSAGAAGEWQAESQSASKRLSDCFFFLLSQPPFVHRRWHWSRISEVSGSSTVQLQLRSSETFKKTERGKKQVEISSGLSVLLCCPCYSVATAATS